MTFQNSNGYVLDQNEISRYVLNTFKAFADSIIPQSPGMAELYGRIQYYGALDEYTDEYLIMSLNSLIIPYAIPTAEILNMAAAQFISINEDNQGVDNLEKSSWMLLYDLLPIARLQAVNLLLLQPMDYVMEAPIPFRNDQGNILFITMLINRLAMMGYYSEWSGYGTTRLKPPNQRKLEHNPISWQQIGYPGPSLGYRISPKYDPTVKS